MVLSHYCRYCSDRSDGKEATTSGQIGQLVGGSRNSCRSHVRDLRRRAVNIVSTSKASSMFCFSIFLRCFLRCFFPLIKTSCVANFTSKVEYVIIWWYNTRWYYTSFKYARVSPWMWAGSIVHFEVPYFVTLETRPKCGIWGVNRINSWKSKAHAISPGEEELQQHGLQCKLTALLVLFHD